MGKWALDLGTSNTGLAYWDDEGHRPRLLQLSEVCRKPSGSDAMEAPRLVPSATEVLREDSLGFWGKLGKRPFFVSRFFWGQHALIGRPAVERSEASRVPGFAPVFKGALERAPLKTLASLDGRDFSARDICQYFLRELFRQAELATGERIRELTVTAPVDAYETYRAELKGVCSRLGVKKLHFLDEPVAAAMGYGVNLTERRCTLVADFGAGTLDLALVDLDVKGASKGSCKVLAKAGRAVGGNLVDKWIVEEFCERMGYSVDPEGSSDERFWYRLMIAEARRVKEALFFEPKTSFNVTPPEDVRMFEHRIQGGARGFNWDKDRLTEVLRQRGLYAEVEACLADLEEQAEAEGLPLDRVDDVLMVGGSTLLPEVYGIFEKRFGRDRVRPFLPFEAVAYGACAFAAGEFAQSDFIVHDYAFMTYHPKTHEPEYTTIIPKGTRIPTSPRFWTRRLVPTCSLGEPETFFKLVVCELGRPDEGERTFSWDEGGQLHKLGGRDGKEFLAVPLNEANPTLGTLNPPHSPRDRSARLEISFGVNGDRWLCAQVRDLKTKKQLLKDEPVVRLL